jgi:hypothetical protein
MRVCRCDGIPVVVETKCSLGIAAHGFLASTALLSMQTTGGAPATYRHEYAPGRRKTDRTRHQPLNE